MAVVGVTEVQTTPYAGGRSFGDVGKYVLRRLAVEHAVDPRSEANGRIVDLELAVTEADGLVHFSHDVTLLTPTDRTRSNGRLLVDVVNRGRPLVPGYINRDNTRTFPPPEEPPPGDGYLFDQGWTVAHVGWQFDIEHESLLGLRAPAVLDDGDQLSGEVEFTIQPPFLMKSASMTLPGHRPWMPTSDGSATLWESNEDGYGENEVPRSEWNFSEDGKRLARVGGLQPGVLYRCRYGTSGAVVPGCGLLALRDVPAWINSEIDVNTALLLGISQCGRVVRHFLYDAMNTDEQGLRVYDGVMPVLAGGRLGQFNQRFASPGIIPKDAEGLGGPVSYSELLAEVSDPPKLMALNTSTEYWRGDAWLVHEDEAANVRVHHVAGTQHSPGVIPQMFEDPVFRTKGRYGFGTVDYRPILRALLSQLVDWVEGGEAAEPSTYPTSEQLTDRAAALDQLGSLGFEVPDAESFGFPSGPVPALDVAGNEVGGIRLPDIEVPLGVHTGWNLRHPDIGASTQQLVLRGASVWNSVNIGAEEFRSGVRGCIENLVGQRFVLAEDLPVLIADAEARWEAAKQESAG